MLIASLLLIGGVLVVTALAEAAVRRLPLSPALVYLAAGWAAAWVASPPLPEADLERHATLLRVASEIAVLVSLFAIGLKIRMPATWRAWRVPALLATAGMLWSVALAAGLAWLLLPLDWPLALLLAAILAPTDPVLASDVQVHGQHDRDALRLSLTAEGALNDGTAYPIVMLALGLLGLHGLGENGLRWALRDVLWSIAAGIALGVACGRAIGWAMLRRLRVGSTSDWDELLYLGAIALVYGLALAAQASAFLAVLAAGVTLLRSRPSHPPQPEAQQLGQQMQAFGARCERLVEVLMVLVIGAALTRVQWSTGVLAFAGAMLLLVRPFSVMVGVPSWMLPLTQRSMMAWFGIRGVGSVFYLALALQYGIGDFGAQPLVSACLATLALSIALHGVSATPLMNRYQRRRETRTRRPH